MLESVFEFIGEIVLEGLYELFKWRIENHPYLTCVYRGLLVAALIYLCVTIKHYFIDNNWAQMALYDAGVGLGIWAFLSGLLMVVVFFRKREQNRY